jgi:excisionase family DNA binding protein
VKVFKLEDLLKVATLSVEEAANLVGISRTKAYAMAKEGDFFEVITDRSGNRIRVLARPLYIKLIGSALDEVMP